MRVRIDCSERREGGFAIVAVLWFLVLTSAVVAPFAVSARTQWLLSSHLQQQARLEAVSEALFEILSTSIMRGDRVGAASFDLPLNSVPILCKIGRYEILVRLQDQRGLIDLNVAKAELLPIGFTALGLSSQKSSVIAQIVLDYRDYTSTGVARNNLIFGGPKNAPFESVIELSDFADLRSLAPEQIRSVFTVHSRLPSVALSRAPVELSRALAGPAPHIDYHPSEPVAAISVEVAARDTSLKIIGSSAYMIQATGGRRTSHTRIEKLAESEIADWASIRSETCPSQLQSLLSQLLGAGKQ